MTKNLLVVAFTLCCFVVQGAGIQADHVVTDSERKRIEVGKWVEDEKGRSRFDLDDLTQIVDPVEGIMWSANSKRGRYTKSSIIHTTPPMGTPLIHQPGSLNSVNTRETSRIDLGTRRINGVECKGTQVELRELSGGFSTRIEVEAWHTEAFAFPINVLFVMRSEGSEHKTELRYIVQLMDNELEGVFEPPADWKKSLLPLVRATATRTGVWPLSRRSTKDTTLVLPWRG